MSNTINIKDLKDLISGEVTKVEANVNGLKDVIGNAISKVEERIKVLEEKEARMDETEKKMQAHADAAAQKIVLDIGGQKFAASKNILLSVGSGRWKPDADGAYFVDRNPELFPVILDFLRIGKGPTKKYGYDTWGEFITDLNVELDFYQIKMPAELLCREFEGSRILQGTHKLTLFGWISKRHATLLYSASRDGFSAASFHKLCDNKGKTLTVIHSTGGYIFGGYTDHNWDGSSNYKNGSSWLFTLTNPVKSAPQQYNCTSHGIYCNSGYGTTFGGGHDIYVASDSNANNNSYCGFPNSYTDTTGRGNNTFTGAYNFQTNEIEVYLIQ